MPHYVELLLLSRQMVDRNPGAAIEAELRRAISTAYYALFHLLVDKGTDRIVAIPSLRARVARTFDHSKMRDVCREYAEADAIGSGDYRTKKTLLVFPSELLIIAKTFTELQDARHRADYDFGRTISHADASVAVKQVEAAFREWIAVEAHSASNDFLAELWCRGIPKR